jgi:hypothetical protein
MTLSNALRVALGVVLASHASAQPSALRRTISSCFGAMQRSLDEVVAIGGEDRQPVAQAGPEQPQRAWDPVHAIGGIFEIRTGLCDPPQQSLDELSPARRSAPIEAPAPTTTVKSRAAANRSISGSIAGCASEAKLAAGTVRASADGLALDCAADVGLDARDVLGRVPHPALQPCPSLQPLAPTGH